MNRSSARRRRANPPERAKLIRFPRVKLASTRELTGDERRWLHPRCPIKIFERTLDRVASRYVYPRLFGVWSPYSWQLPRRLEVIDPKVVEALVAAKTRAERSPLNELTPREREVLAEIAQGSSNAAIGESLFLTKRAVEKHINSIFMKLGLGDAGDVSKRVKAALIFLADGAGELQGPHARV